MTWKEFSDPNRIDQQASQKLVGNITDGYSFVDPIKYAAQLKTERKTNRHFRRTCASGISITLTNTMVNFVGLLERLNSVTQRNPK